MDQFIQNVNGDHAEGKQIGKMRDYYEGKSITIGLSADEVNEILQAIEALRKEDREEIDRYRKQISEATSEEEKKGIARRAAGFIRERCCGIFDSLVASGILSIMK